jgi:hypothetical protein
VTHGCRYRAGTGAHRAVATTGPGCDDLGPVGVERAANGGGSEAEEVSEQTAVAVAAVTAVLMVRVVVIVVVVLFVVVTPV